MEPLSTTQFLFSSLIRVIVQEEGHHVVFPLFLGDETVMVLPVVLVHSEHEWSPVNFFLFAPVMNAFILLMLQVHAILVWQPLVICKETSACQSGNFGCWLPPNQIIVLFVVHHFSNGVGEQVSWQVPQRGVVADAEAAQNCVLLLVREVVEELGQVGQLVMIDRVVDGDALLVMVSRA